MKIELDLPEIEGFELAKGKQPRPVKVGEYSINMETLEATQWNGACTSFDNAIVLKKKAPKYKVLDSVAFDGVYVEIKALEDALTLMGGRVMGGNDTRVYTELKSLIS